MAWPIRCKRCFASVELPIEELDWRERSDTEQALSELAAAEQAKGFDLSCPPLMRFMLVRLGEDRYQMIWTYHHLLLDGWSASRLLGEVLRLYHHDSLPALTGRYADYIAWLQRQDEAQAESFWRERLASLEAPTILATASGATGSGHGVMYSDLDAAGDAQVAQLRQASARHPQHPGARRLAAAAATLHRPAHAWRSAPRWRGGRTGLAGAAEHARPVHQHLAGDPDPATRNNALGDWLRELQAYNLDVRDYEHTPLSDIQRWAGQGGQALFDSIIVFENHPVDRALREWRGRRRCASTKSADGGVTNFPMDLMVSARRRAANRVHVPA